MKADVPRIPKLRLRIPAWVPKPVAQSIRAKYAADVDWAYRAALKESGDYSGPDEHLAAIARQDDVRRAFADVVRDDVADITERYLPFCDRRMEGVWRELSRQRNGAFLHPAKDRQAALVELFETALLCQETRRGATMTTGQVEDQRSRYLAKAEELESDASAIMATPGARRQTERHRQTKRYLRLLDAADVYKEYAAERYWADSLTSLERAHDGRARWVALTIGHKFRELFGSPMYGLTATITSVVLRRTVEPRTVRQWCDPADKARKKST